MYRIITATTNKRKSIDEYIDYLNNTLEMNSSTEYEAVPDYERDVVNIIYDGREVVAKIDLQTVEDVVQRSKMVPATEEQIQSREKTLYVRDYYDAVVQKQIPKAKTIDRISHRFEKD